MSETEIKAVPTEAEMLNFRHMFERVALTITEAAGLQASFAELRVQVDSLKRDLDEVRDRNRWLDKELNEVRVARDAYRSQKYELENAVSTLKEANDKLQGTVNQLQDSNTAIAIELNTLRINKDDIELKNMGLEDQVATLSGQLDIIKDFARQNFGLVDVPKPVPQVTETPAPLAESVSDTQGPTDPFSDPMPGTEEYNKLPWWEQDKIDRRRSA